MARLEQLRCHWGLPFLRQVVGAVVWLEVDPLPSRQVQPVQVSAVDVTRRPTKHVEETIYDNHCLKEDRCEERGWYFKVCVPTRPLSILKAFNTAESYWLTR